MPNQMNNVTHVIVRFELPDLVSLHPSLSSAYDQACIDSASLGAPRPIEQDFVELLEEGRRLDLQSSGGRIRFWICPVDE